MILSKDQYDKLPAEYKQYFVVKEGGDVSSGGRINIHPT